LAPIKSDLTASVGDYIFEPSKKRLTLIPKSLKTQLYKGSEIHCFKHGARMTAMHKATDNNRVEKSIEIDLQ
jgi:F-type H+-transporting ATPase subunit gamma